MEELEFLLRMMGVQKIYVEGEPLARRFPVVEGTPSQEIYCWRSPVVLQKNKQEKAHELLDFTSHGSVGNEEWTFSS